jgi:glycine cleavage system regulatory protein
MFHAQIRVMVPEAASMADVRRGLERLADDLMVEIRLAEALGTGR